MENSENYLRKSVWGTVGVLFCLLLLSIIPEFDFYNFHYRRINLLADVELKKYTAPVNDTVTHTKPVFSDTCKTGIVCIEDYTADSTGMLAFLQALDSSRQRKVRIAWFGDSFVEGDIFLAPLRDTLQAVFGGSGVGFVPISSEVAGFRQTIMHTFSGWNSSTIIGEKVKTHPLGFAGSVFWPEGNAEVKYSSVGRSRLNNFETASLFVTATVDKHVMVNGADRNIVTSNSIQKVPLGNNLKSISLSVNDSLPIDLYGVSFESNTGLSIDNYSMRGNSGIGLSYVSSAVYKRMNELHHPDLIVLSYGLNVANSKAANYDWYARSMTKTVAMIKESFPGSSILLIGCPDRGENNGGKYETMHGIKGLIDVQRKLAMDNQVCFWNMFEAMGGDSTMVRWGGMKKHAFANKDYTHLTFYGGEQMAKITAGTFLYEKEKFDRKKRVLKTIPIEKK
jgi:hypothetical protein